MLRRARITFLAAIIVGALVLASELPLTDLVHARSSVASATAELAKLRTANRSLTDQIHGLREGSTIQQIAHAEYGLVKPGQQAVVVMPGSSTGAEVHGHGSSASSAPLGADTIPKSDLVPSDSELSPPRTKATAGGGGFWNRFVNRLEFWKGSN